MTTSLWVPQRTVLPAPADLAAYLRSRRWTFQSVQLNWAIYTSGEGDSKVTLEIPQLVGARDFGRAILLVVEELARIEGRPPADILSDVRAASFDVVRLSLEGSTMRDGRIPVSAGIAAYEGARSLLMAAACSVIEPRTVFANRKPEEAIKLMERVRFGQTEVGSFVLTLESTVAPLLQATLVDEGHDPDAPFERKTVVRLATALGAAQNATVQSAASGSIDPFRRGAKDGVSSNLCDAVAEVLEGSSAEQFKARFSFASHRPLRGNVPVVASFSADTAPILREAAARLRDEANYPGYVLVGTIVSLNSNDPKEQGSIVIRADVEGRLRRVKVRLPPGEYQRAIDAHKKIELVRCTGDLVGSGGSLVLDNARDLSTVPQPDSET